MDARRWLGRARSIEKEIDSLLNAKAETRDRLEKITQNYSSDGAQVTKDPHKFDKLVELEDMIDRRMNDLVSVKKEITETIGMLDDGRQRTVLFDYYIRGKTLEEAAAELHYSYRAVKRYHRKGIDETEKILSEKDGPHRPTVL